MELPWVLTERNRPSFHSARNAYIQSAAGAFAKNTFRKENGKFMLREIVKKYIFI